MGPDGEVAVKPCTDSLYMRRCTTGRVAWGEAKEEAEEEGEEVLAAAARRGSTPRGPLSFCNPPALSGESEEKEERGYDEEEEEEKEGERGRGKARASEGDAAPWMACPRWTFFSSPLSFSRRSDFFFLGLDAFGGEDEDDKKGWVIWGRPVPPRADT